MQEADFDRTGRISYAEWVRFLRDESSTDVAVSPSRIRSPAAGCIIDHEMHKDGGLRGKGLVRRPEESNDGDSKEFQEIPTARSNGKIEKIANIEKRTSE